MTWNDFDWKPVNESPNFGKKGDKMVDLLLRSNKGYVVPVTMNKDRWAHLSEPEMFPKTKQWAYDTGERPTA